MILEYHCKFCGKPGRVDAGDMVGPYDLKKWIKILCCTRCGEYMLGRRRIQDTIRNICLDLWATRKSERNSEKLKKIEVGIEETLIALTKKYVTLVSAYVNKPIEWDVEMVYSLMEHPQETDKILRLWRLSQGTKRYEQTADNNVADAVADVRGHAAGVSREDG